VIAFDTNHLVRHIVQDDPAQSQAVAELLTRETAAGRTIRILDLVLLETSWVLESAYGFDRGALAEVLGALLDDGAFRFDDADLLRKAIDRFRQGRADFADCLILTRVEAEGLALKTFDRRLAKEIGRSGTP
jgi:predicted nucleic-acid-binding protein